MNQSLEETQNAAPHGLLALIGQCTSRVARAIGEIRDRAALRAEFAHLKDSGQLERVLSDIGVDPAELPTLIRNHPGAPGRLAAMLRHLRIEATKEGRSSFEMRTIERTCSLCEASAKCDHWLRTDGSEDPSTFCPNTQAFHDLIASGKATQRHDA
ncbi:MAG TPA: DUF6455 family protein [Stellaceae bacterium]|nr:DUF6455 family protein [Stellaceae bacterium]